MSSYVVNSETNGPGQIHDAMAAILDELPAIGKDSTNAALRFNFRGIDAIVNALNPLLGKHGVVPVLASSQLAHYAEKAKGYAAVVHNTYRFMAKDGSFLEAQAIGEGIDFGDKAVSKANTMAFKTCLGQVFCLAYEDDPDGESVQGEDAEQSGPTKKAGTRKAAKAAEQKTGAPASPPAAAPPQLQALRDALWAKFEGLSEDERAHAKGFMVEQGMSTNVDNLKAEQIAEVEKYVDENILEPF